MNERLTELYRACRNKEALASQDQYKSADVLIGTELEKFIELLVQECAIHLHQRGVEGFGILEERNLKEHFGVKE